MTENDNKLTPVPNAEGAREFEGRWYVPLADHATLAERYDNTAKAANDLNAQVADARSRLHDANLRYGGYQAKVRQAIADLVENDDLAKSTANEVLEGLDLERLATRYTANIEVEMTVTFEATDADEAEDALTQLEFDATPLYTCLDDFEVEGAAVNSVSITEDE